MSSRLGLGNLSGVQEALVIALMLVTAFALFFSDMDFTYKIGIAALAFSVIFLMTIAGQMLDQMKEKDKKQL